MGSTRQDMRIAVLASLFLSSVLVSNVAAADNADDVLAGLKHQNVTLKFPQWKLCLGDCANARALFLQPLELTAPSFNVTQFNFPNLGSTRQNQVFNFGWNLSAGGGPYVAGEPAMGWSLESHYAPDDFNRFMEAHLLFITSAGAVNRPFSWAFNRTTNRIEGIIVSDRFDFSYPQASSSTMIVMPGFIQLGDMRPVQLFAGFNNAPFLSQLNAAANGFVPIAYVDSSDTVRIASGGHTTAFGGAVQLASGAKWTSGTGAPTSACSIGSLYSRTDAAPALYVCEAPNTWVAK
jgi:hypothetical protein